MPEKQRLLLVEDDVSLSEWIQDYLQQHDYEVYIEHHGDRVLERLEVVQPALLILDIMLPGKNGFDICRELKPRSPLPILMLTARDDEIDQVVGLELGADDYMTKPVKPRVLLARIQALLRRTQSPPADVKQLNVGRLHMDYSSREIWYDGQVVSLSDAELDLLWLLASCAGEVLSRDYILRSLRGIDYDGLDRSIDGHISMLRRKFNGAGDGAEKIKTVRNKGYMFVPQYWS